MNTQRSPSKVHSRLQQGTSAIATLKLQLIFYFFSFLAHGDSYRSLANRFRMSTATVSHIVRDTCIGIWSALQPTEMPVPSTEDWIKIERQFATRWNFPNCVGALDGKHVLIEAPPNSGSVYHNYKGTFSVNLMALADANYKFTIIDVGQYGSNADGGVFQRSEMGRRFYSRGLNIPEPKVIPNANHIGLLPHCIVADEAFPLRIDLMRPYPRRSKNENLPEDRAIFNYRLSRARRIVENSFGILVQRWRVFNRRLKLDHENVVHVIKASCILHNFLRETPEYHDRGTLVVNQEGDVIIPNAAPVVNVAYLRGYHSAKDALATRELFKTYFTSPEGALPWQLERIREQ